MLQIRLLGELEAEVEGRRIELPRSRRAREVLAWLALHPGRHPRGELAARFWPDVLDSSARASLRSALWSLRRALGADARRLVATREVVGLDPTAEVWVDAAAFEALVGAGRHEEALALVRGDLLADLDADWVLTARPRHREAVAGAAALLAARAQEARDERAAIAWSRRAVELDPLHEDHWRTLIGHLVAVGDAAGALAAYRALRERLRRELGIAPSDATKRLVDDARLQPAPAPTGAAAHRSSHHPPLVGRERELQELAVAAGDARAGRGSAVAVTGEPGIGKTRLVAALAESAREDGALVVTAAASGPHPPRPFSLWEDALDELAEEVRPPEDREWVAELARVAPRLRGRLPAAAALPDDLPPGLRRARLLEASAELLTRAAQQRWVVLALEDLHAADPASLELARYVARRLANLRVLLVLTRRDAPLSPIVDSMLEELRSRDVLAAELTLAPLAADDVRRLAHLVAPLPDVERVVDAAGGTPLLAVETARAIARGETAVPGSLRSLVRAWLGGIDSRPRTLAELVAVARRDLDRAELAALEVPFDDAAASAADAGLLTVRGRRIGFRHALLGDAVHADLPAGRRMALHERLADALAKAGGRAGEVAGHLRRAGRHERAVEALRAAADHARSVADLAGSASFVEAALELSPGCGELWLQLAELHAWRNRGSDAEAAFERALTVLEPADAAARADAWVRRATWYKSSLCVPRLALESGLRALEILDAAGVALADTERNALAVAAWAQAVAGDPAQAERLLDRLGALEADRQPGDLLRCHVENARGLALLRKGRFGDAVESLADAARAGARAGRPDLAGACWDEAACAATCTGEFEQALALNARGLAATSDRGLLAVEVRQRVIRSQLLLRLGRTGQARGEAERAAKRAASLGSEEVIAEADHQRGLVALARAEHERAAALVAAALASDPPVSRPLARLALAEALVGLDRVDDAAEEVRAAALEPVGAGDFPDTLVPRLTRLQGLVAAARGDPLLARRRLDQAAAGLRRRLDRETDGGRYTAALADLGRAPLAGLADPVDELERVLAERDGLTEDARDTTAAEAEAQACRRP